jgi:hypothetical protein
MRLNTLAASILFINLAVWCAPLQAIAEGELLEFSCQSCGYRERFAQGFDQADEARNVQRIIVVCERNKQIRTIKIPLDPKLPVNGEPLLARQYGTGYSELLGMNLPKFLVPGNTCPLYPITAYLDRNICPVDGRMGLEFKVIEYF